MAKKKAPSAKPESKPRKASKLKDLTPKPASTRMVSGGRRRYIT